MSALPQLLASGLALGAVYALVALGFVVIYRASKVFNFAQGELLTLGAFLMVTFSGWGLPWPLALAGTLLATGALAAGVERVVLRPLVGRPVFVTIILTIFVGAILRTVVLLVWGTDRQGMPTPWDETAKVAVGGARILVNSVATFVAAGLALASFFLLVRRTRLGVAMRATASDQEAALAHGIPVGRIFGASWFLAGVFAALGGVFLGMFPGTVDKDLGYVALHAFPAVIIGGLESAGGAVVAGLLLGLLEVLAQTYVNPGLGSFGLNFHAVFPYLVMIGFLMVRPYGLFGTRKVERL